jgi:hypothetical protein
MKPNSIYSQLVTWAAERVFESCIFSAPMKYIENAAREFDLTPKQNADCGLEIHHTLPHKIDFAILANPKSLRKTGSNTIENWNGFNNLLRMPKDSSTINYDPKCFYEIDFADKSPMLAGVFYSLKLNRPESNSKTVLSDLADGLCVFSNNYRAIAHSSAVDNLLSLTEPPLHIGRMIGRGDILKLVCRIPPTHLRNIPEIVPDLFERLPLMLWLKFLQDIQHCFADLFISVDLNLSEDEWLPRFGLELYFARGSERREAISSFFRVAAGLVPVEDREITELIMALPYGQKFHSTDLENSVASLPKHPPDIVFIADLSHLKVVFSAPSSCFLKSYIRLSALALE